MTTGMEKLEAAVDECGNHAISDGNPVWSAAIDAMQAAIDYQKEKQAAAMRKAYGRRDGRGEV